MIRIITLAGILVASQALASRPQGDQRTRALDRASHQIQSILDSISSLRVHRDLDTLVAFTYRHTMDDTVSQTTGMGAARRWIYRKFQEISTATGGRLQPQYFDFTATICGANRLHRNVMAVLPGTFTPNRYFIVSGHMDTRGHPSDPCAYGIFSPGANDDASGTVISIELARVMSRYEFDASIIFMAVTGEDEGLFGSEAYAAYAQNTGMRIDGMITNDVVGNITGQNGITDSTSVRHFSSVADATHHRQLARYMKLKSEFYYPEMTVNLIPAVDRPGRGGDHQSFQNHGYAGVRFTEPNENLNHQHTATDIVENMSPAYTARVARVNVAGLASLLWAPERPAQPAVLDPGTGTTLLVQWTQTNTEPDFAGYRIAVRDSGGLFYNTIVDAGNVTQHTVGGLTPGVSVYVSISAYDTAGHESLFSTETLARPTAIPTAPQNPTSTSTAADVLLTWQPVPQLDIAGYRIYRSFSRTGGFGLYDSVSAPSTSYTDNTLALYTLYFYHIRAVDADGNEGPPSTVVAGQRVTHDRGVLIVDATRDGAPAPPDSIVDAYYNALLSDFPLGGEWDVADSLAMNIRISDAEMGRYSTIVWHTDVRGSAPMHQDTAQIRKYLQNGGRLFMCGWRLAGSWQSVPPAGITAFPPGSFVPQFVKVDSTLTSGPLTPDFAAAIASLAGYADVRIDSAKTPIGGLANTDVALPPFTAPLVEVVYTHSSRLTGSPLEGKPVGWRYLSSEYRIVVFDFPLYYMRSDHAHAALRRALLDLGEVVSVRSSEIEIPLRFELHQNYPNPFNPVTLFEFRLPAVQAGIAEFELVSLKVFDILGREVATIVNESLPPGAYVRQWDGSRFASGVYFYRLQAGSFTETRKLMLLR